MLREFPGVELPPEHMLPSEFPLDTSTPQTQHLLSIAETPGAGRMRDLRACCGHQSPLCQTWARYQGGGGESVGWGGAEPEPE